MWSRKTIRDLTSELIEYDVSDKVGRRLDGLLAIAMALVLAMVLCATARASDADLIPDEGRYQGPHGFSLARPLSLQPAILETAWQVENLIDLQQTLRIAENPDRWNEVGGMSPFTGPHPSKRQVYLWTGVFALSHYAITQALADHPTLQAIWGYSSLGYKSWNMRRNVDAGLGY